MTFCNTGLGVQINIVIMDSHAENTKRIAKNTLMLYIRMLFSMLVSLYTSRVVLNTLGVEDYGIYNVVGGFVAMFSMVSSSLSSAVSRFLTFELGKGNMERLKETFSTSLMIHLALAGIVFILAESVGVWFLNTQMTIPEERLYAANWVFQASILAFMFGLYSVPYNASITSHERMSAFAYIGIFDVMLRLLIVLFIAYAPLSYDKLIVYSLLLVAVRILFQYINRLYCRRNFEECRIVKLSFNKAAWKEMSAFAGWNFIGCTAVLLKDQGVNILLNFFFGPIINAARGIAVSVNAAVTGFAGNFMAAVNPQITKSYAAGDREYMFSLVERGSRFSFYIMLILALPILLETEFVLTLWLEHYPEHTVNFVRLVLILSLCDVISNTLITLQVSTGKIRKYQLAVGGMLMMNFPLSYICLKEGFASESVFLTAIAISICCLLLRLWFLRNMVGLSMFSFLKNVCLRSIVVTAIAVIVPIVVASLIDYSGWKHFLLVALVCLICCSISIYFLGCSHNERNFIQQNIDTIKYKFRIK